MHRWQRLVRYALAIFAVVFAAGVYFAIRERPNGGDPSAASGRTDLAAAVESVGGTSQIAKETQQTFAIDYGRMLSYPDGRARFLEGIHVKVPQRGGRTFDLVAKQGETTQDQSSVVVEGDVELKASDGLVANAARATYESADAIVRVPERVTFARNRMSGSANGATYDRNRDVLWLLADAKIVIKPDKTGAGATDLTAGAAGFARRERYIRFERALKMVREGQVIEADGAMAYLAPEEDTLQMVELRGNSRITKPSQQPGDLQAMSARDMNLHYSEDGSVLQRAVLAYDAVIRLAGQPGQEGRRLSAGSMELLFAEDGNSLVSLAARDAVELTLPGEGGAPGRRIKADSLEASGPAGQGITTAQFREHVSFTETRPATKDGEAVNRHVGAKALDAVVKPGFGALEAAVFSGGMAFTDGPMSGTAPDATYNVAKGTMQLVAGGDGAGAQVEDQQATIEARTIDLTLDGRSFVADGDVRSVLKAASGDKSRTVRRPGMLKADQAVNVSAAHLVYDSSTSQATYTGEPRLWQGETAVQGTSIMLDDKAGNLHAAGSVRSTWRLEDTDPKTKKTEMKTTVATGDDLLYEDEQRRATYTTNARMNGPEGDLRADKIELFLDKSGSRLDRVEAYNNVTLVSETRHSAGARLSYFAAEERYVMGGTPVRVLEQLPAECRETLGRTLTFYRATDSILVDGNEERRTQTTSGGKCPEPRGQ
jgi:lipopolysaccharide export system protein LptA